MHHASSGDAASHEVLVAHYLHLTGTVMPRMARAAGNGWPVVNDHCFQRIVLDTICGGVWYDHIARPAYKHLSVTQAKHAVQVAEDIIHGRVNLSDLNRQSLIWRGKGQSTGTQRSSLSADRSAGRAAKTS